MNSKTYTKSPVNLDLLIQQIKSSSITETLDLTNTSVFGTLVTITFLTDLLPAEWTTMDNIIAAHTGQSNTSTVIIEVTSNPSVSGLEADLGSVATVVDGSGLWVKTAAPNTGWSRPLPPLASDGISTIVSTATASAGISTNSARGDHVHATLTATSSQTGLLSNTDWNTFNSKTVAFEFSRQGQLTVGTYLKTSGGVPSSVAGQPIVGTSLVQRFGVSVSSVIAGAPSVFQVQTRSGATTFADIADATVSIPIGSYQATLTGLNIQLSADQELSVYFKSGGAPINPVATVYVVPQ